MMRQKRVPAREHVAGRLVALIHTAVEKRPQDTENIQSIGFAVEESVKQAMRALAQEGYQGRDWRELLRAAIHQTERDTKAGLSPRTEFDLRPYLKEAEVSLMDAAKEMSHLSVKLRESKAAKRLYDKDPLTEHSPSSEQFEITKLGLRDSVEGLVAHPLAPVPELDLDAVAEKYRLEGDWFPYEVAARRLTITIDDDGTIAVSTENFPNELVEEAEAILGDIAKRLYATG